MWSLFVDVEWSLQHPIFRLINEWRLMIITFWISNIHEHPLSPSKSCASLPGWSNALSRYSLSLSLSLPCFWNPIWQYTRYTRVGARNMVWHAFFFVMCAMDCGSSLPMNFDIVILKMPNDWTDNTYTHSFLCLKTDLWSKNNSSNCPTFPKLLFFTPCFWCCCGAYIYI